MNKLQKLTKKEVILKESFKEYLIENDMDFYILDRHGEYPFPNSLGCYKDDTGHWTVYNVSDRGEIFESQTVKTQTGAYEIFAERAGLKYAPVLLGKDQVLLNLERENVSLKERFFDYNLDEEIKLLKQSSSHTHSTHTSRKSRINGFTTPMVTHLNAPAYCTTSPWQRSGARAIKYKTRGVSI